MSRTYSFGAMLNLNYSEKNILSILENGAKFGCIYKNWDHNNSQCDTINSYQATVLIWSRSIEKYQYGPLIITEYHKANFTIGFYNRNNKIYLRISTHHIAWKKHYDLCAWYGINFYRYQSLMLHLIGNTIITHFKTY